MTTTVYSQFYIMPPYNPPNTFYSQVAALSNKQDMFKFIGKNGCNFKKVTETLDIEYVWWDMNKNVIELWGPHKKLLRARKIMQHYIDTY